MTIQKKDRPVYHQQLVDYYNLAHPDWTNAQKGNAIWRDLCKIRKYAKADYRGKLPDHHKRLTICGMFQWSDSPEGWDYWSARYAH